jgi:hypothetical protein
MTRRRQPRPPRTATDLPATFVAAEDRIIKDAVLKWAPALEPLLSSEACHRFLKADFLRRLEAGAGTLDAGIICDIARNRHPPADDALRDFIELRIQADRFQELPLSVREYARWAQRNPPLPHGYSSKAPQTANNFIRDVAIAWLIDQVKSRWPTVPLLHSSSHRRSAVAIVGGAFGQARRIYKARGEIARRYAEFMVGFSDTRTNEPPSFVGYS